MLMRLITAVAIILALLSTTTLATQIFKFQQGVNNGYGVYEGGHDLTIIRPGYVSRPDTYLRIETEYPTGREVYNTLIRFDNLEDQLAGKQVLEASITLTYYDDGMPQPWVEAVVHTHPSLKPWSDVNADWNNYDTGLLWEQPGAQGPTDRQGTYTVTGMGPRTGVNDAYQDGQRFTFALNTNWVQSWVDNPATNYGVIMAMDPVAQVGVQFYSSDYEDNLSYRPELTVVIPEPCTIGLLSLGGIALLRRRRR